MAFVDELDAFHDERLAPVLGRSAADVANVADPERLLAIALANEINVSELAATWMPTTPEIDVKLAFARQAGDEASHFRLVADRLAALGVDVAGFEMPRANPMFDYLRGLGSTVERVAAGLYTLEAIAYGVNEHFMTYCDRRGDAETVRIYRDYIQPDERSHRELGRSLIVRLADTPERQRTVRDTVGRLLEIAGTTRAAAADKLGTACFPGC
jgi:hypothetical protein